MRRRKELDVKAIVDEYLAGDVPAVIAARHGVATQTVRSRLIEAGVLRPSRKELDVNAIVDAYRAGTGPTEIAARYGVSAQTVRNRLTQAGVQLRTHPGPKDLPMDQVAAEYLRGDPLPVLGPRYGVHPETIRRKLMRHGVSIRDQETAQRVRYNRHGDLTGLAADLGISEANAQALLIKHGFLYEGRTPAHEAATDAPTPHLI